MNFRGTVNGEIEVEHAWHQGVERPTPRYKLNGGPIVYVGQWAIHNETDACDGIPDSIFTIGAYRLYPLGQDFARDAVIAAVIDGPFWRLAVLRYWLQTVGQRLIATARVWGLADWPMGEEAGWRHVYPVRWAMRLLRRI